MQVFLSSQHVVVSKDSGAHSSDIASRVQAYFEHLNAEVI
jgi:hypothetical protein